MTLPQYLAAHGYRTVTAGKIFHDGSIPAAERSREFNEWEEIDFYKNVPPRKFVNTPDPIKLMDWGRSPRPTRSTTTSSSRVGPPSNCNRHRPGHLRPGSTRSPSRSSSPLASACRTSRSTSRSGGLTSTRLTGS